MKIEPRTIADEARYIREQQATTIQSLIDCIARETGGNIQVTLHRYTTPNGAKLAYIEIDGTAYSGYLNDGALILVLRGFLTVAMTARAAGIKKGEVGV